MKWIGRGIGAFIIITVLLVYSKMLGMDPKIAGIIIGYFAGMYIILT